MRSAYSLAAASLLAHAAAQAVMGFNSGATLNGGAAKTQSDFEKEFKAAANLEGAPGSFTSVRLYTNIQAGTTNTPSSAFQAAIDTNTTMLLGIWCSGTTTIANELDALNSAISQYGSDFTKLVIGISVGSEDLYRDSATGVKNKAGVGNGPDAIVKFVKETRDAIANTPLSSAPVGHVDTYDVWSNSSIKPVVEAIDFLGTDAYPYFESSKGNNSIEHAKTLFDNDFAEAKSAAGGKPIWITETGWPTAGPNWGDAVPSVSNAQKYWDQVGCELFGKTNTWWYTMYDSNSADAASFAVTDNFSTTPKYNLTCPEPSASSSASASGSSATGTRTAVITGLATATGGLDVTPSGSASPSSAASASNGAPAYLAGMVVAGAAACLMA